MNQRIFVEKKSAFDVESHKVLAELQEFAPLTHLKQYVIYDVFDAQEESWDKLKTVLLAYYISYTLLTTAVSDARVGNFSNSLCN